MRKNTLKKDKITLEAKVLARATVRNGDRPSPLTTSRPLCKLKRTSDRLSLELRFADKFPFTKLHKLDHL